MTALPEAARLLHIGPFKTGTTALQSAAAARRARLLELGVRYPGQDVNHSVQTASLLGAQRVWHADGPPGPEAWRRLMREVETDRRRALLSHELLANLGPTDARRVLDALGPDTHVVITLRPLAAILPSDWQQQVKSGRRVADLDVWVRRCLDAVDRRTDDTDLARRSDHGALVRRWVAAAGTDRVVVVAVDRDDPTLVFRAFEELLSLPAGTLTPSAHDGYASNRALTLAEVELLRSVGSWAADRGLSGSAYSVLVRRGLVARLQAAYAPGPDEARPIAPGGERERLGRLQERFADEIRASGARVVGDLRTLLTLPAAPTSDPAHDLPLAAATAAVLGVLERAAELEERSRRGLLRHATDSARGRLRSLLGR